MFVTRLRGGLIAAFFFRIRISELLGLTQADVEFVEEPGRLAMSIRIRPDKTDQGKLGVRRTLRSGPSRIFPVSTFHALWLQTGAARAKTRPPAQRFERNWPIQRNGAQ